MVVSYNLSFLITYSLHIYTFTLFSVIMALVLFILTLLRFFRFRRLLNVDYFEGERVLHLALTAAFGTASRAQQLNTTRGIDLLTLPKDVVSLLIFLRLYHLNLLFIRFTRTMDRCSPRTCASLRLGAGA